MTDRNDLREFIDTANSGTGARFDGPLPSDRTTAHFEAARLDASERPSDVSIRDELRGIAGEGGEGYGDDRSGWGDDEDGGTMSIPEDGDDETESFTGDDGELGDEDVED